MDLLILLIFNSLVIIGFWFASGYEVDKQLTKVAEKPDGTAVYMKRVKHHQIFGLLHYYFKELFGEVATKPVFSCPVCMSSVHGTWFFWTFVHTGTIEWITWTLALAGLMTLCVHRGFIKTWMV